MKYIFLIFLLFICLSCDGEQEVEITIFWDYTGAIEDSIRVLEVDDNVDVIREIVTVSATDTGCTFPIKKDGLPAA